MSGTPNGPIGRRRLLLISALFVIIGIVAWLLKINEIISDLGAVFTILGVLLPLLHEGPPSTHSPPAPLAGLTIQKQGQEKSYIEIEEMTSATLGLTKDRGALFVHTNSDQLDLPIGLTFGFNESCARPDIVEHVVKCRMNNRSVFVCVFPGLLEGKYTVCSDRLGLKEKVIIHARAIKEVNWRRRTHRHTTYQQRIEIAPVQSNKED